MLHKTSTTGTGSDALLIAFVANRGGQVLELDATGEKTTIPVWLKDRKAGAAVWFAGISPAFQAQLRADLAPDMAKFKHAHRIRK